MNYEKAYRLLCTAAKARSQIDGYSEKHHIVPRCLGGDDSAQNIVKLTSREHFIAHKLLCKINTSNLKLAFALMCMASGSAKSAVGHVVSSRQYAIARQNYSNLLKLNHPKRGTALSEYQKKKISESSPRISGKNHSMFGKKHSEESKRKMSESSRRMSGVDHPMFGASQTIDAKNKMSIASQKRMDEKRANMTGALRLINKQTGESFHGIRFDFCKKYSFQTSSSGMSLFWRGIQKTYKGWAIDVDAEK